MPLIRTPPCAVFFYFSNNGYNMTKALQLRRGTTAKNDNFTGLPGEITFDTKIKTLRVHDGETLGGFTVARADGGDLPGYFNIKDVPDEFWKNIFKKFQPEKKCTIMVKDFEGTFHSRVSEFGTFTRFPGKVIFANIALICVWEQDGYEPGDVVSAFGTDTTANPIPTIREVNYPEIGYYNGYDIYFRFEPGSLWISHKITGKTVPLDPTRWGQRLVVWLEI
jgi:hypothetical protein